jgi:hypothetical protein
MKATTGQLLKWEKGQLPSKRNRRGSPGRKRGCVWACRVSDGEYVVAGGEMTFYGDGRRITCRVSDGNNAVARQYAEDHYAERHPLLALAAQAPGQAPE